MSRLASTDRLGASWPGWSILCPSTTVDHGDACSLAVSEVQIAAEPRTEFGKGAARRTRRAGKIYRAAAPDLQFVVVAAPDISFTPDGWWHNRQGKKIAFNEWLKTVTEPFGI